MALFLLKVISNLGHKFKFRLPLVFKYFYFGQKSLIKFFWGLEIQDVRGNVKILFLWPGFHISLTESNYIVCDFCRSLTELSGLSIWPYIVM